MKSNSFLHEKLKIINPEDYKIEIDILNLTIRTYNCLRRNGISMVSQIIVMALEDKLLDLRNLGSKTKFEIEEKLIGFLSENEIGHSHKEDKNLPTQYNIGEIITHLKINERAWIILKKRSQNQTYQTIAEIFGVSRSRIQQIDKQYRKKIKNRLHSFEDFFDFLESHHSEIFKDEKIDRDFNESIRSFSNEVTKLGKYEVTLQISEKLILILRILSNINETKHLKRWGSIMFGVCSIKPIMTTHPKIKSTIITKNKLQKKMTYAQLGRKVLTDFGKPMHWSEISNKAEELNRRKSFNSTALYNALMSHKSIFVRVGQGTYGLLEWGLNEVEYFTDIIAKFLKENGGPLPFSKILFEIRKIRNVKKTTLCMTLDMHPRFYKARNNTFGLRVWLPERSKQNLLTPIEFTETKKSYERIERAKSKGYNIEKILETDR